MTTHETPGPGHASDRQCAPSADRNKDPILSVLRGVLPATGRVLEVSAGTGQHAAFFAAALPHLTWLPTEADPTRLPSLRGWRAHAVCPNLEAPALLDASVLPWTMSSGPVPEVAAVFNANCIHIAPWEVCLGLLAGASAALPVGGPLVMYGPYLIDGRHTAPSNVAFDHSLKRRDPRWGVRDLTVVRAEAARVGLDFIEARPMPANNFVVVYRKTRT